jgi:peptidoglycan/LPS O-acetylase OafA/YrhL
MNGIILLKFIATILITNSHFGVLYPSGYEVLATGGTIGNSLFFFVSGYNLFFSNKDIFFKWISKRFIRIYIPLWIFNIVSYSIPNKWNMVNFILPDYWFLKAILVFYIVYYVVTKYLADKLFLVVFLLITGYLLTYFLNNTNKWVIEITDNPTYIHWYYYFGIMLLGAVTAKNKGGKIFEPNTYFNGLAIFTILYYGSKYIMLKYSLLQYQFLIPILLFFICFCAFHYFNSLKIKSNVIHKIFFFISSLTLEIYLVQFVIIKSLKNLHFPISFVLAAIFIIFTAYLLNLIAAKLTNGILDKHFNARYSIKN